MKNIILSLCLFLTSTCLWAQSPIPASIAKLHQQGETIVGQFTQVDAQPKLKKETTRQGTYYFMAPDNLRLDYTDGTDDYTLMRADAFIVNRKGKVQKLPIKNAEGKMAIFRQTLLYALSGQVEALVSLNKATATYTEKGGKYICELKKDVKTGIKALTLTYDTKTGVLLSIRVDEANSNYTTYSTASPKQGVAIEADKWK